MFCYTLTISVNAYDQYGEYLLVVFKDIPSLEELSESLEEVVLVELKRIILA